MTDGVDQGWWAAVPKALMSLVPVFGRTSLRSASRLVVARALVLRTILAMWFLLAVLIVLAGTGDADGGFVPWALLGGVSLLGVVSVIRLRRIPPKALRPGTEPAALFTSHTAKLDAAAVAPALVGFVGFFLGGGLACYVAGMLVCHALLAFAVPSHAMIDRLQGWLEQLGYDTDLHSAIVAQPWD